jgi:hypothetical protein
MTATEILRDFEVLTIGQVAVVPGFQGSDKYRRECVRELIHDGRLRIIDERQPLHRWTVSAAEVQRYIERRPITKGKAS